MGCEIRLYRCDRFGERAKFKAVGKSSVVASTQIASMTEKRLCWCPTGKFVRRLHLVFDEKVLAHPCEFSAFLGPRSNLI